MTESSNNFQAAKKQIVVCILLVSTVYLHSIGFTHSHVVYTHRVDLYTVAQIALTGDLHTILYCVITGIYSRGEFVPL